MFDQSTNKNVITSVVIIVIVLGSFGVGYNFGVKKTYAEFSVPSVKNKDAAYVGDITADFAPFWKAWNTLNQKYVPTSTSTNNVSDQDKVWGAIKGLAGAYGDPYTTFFPPVDSKNFNEQIEGNFIGIGAELSIKDDQLIVVSPLKGSPAESAGLLTNDYIIAIDGKTTAGLSIDDAIKQIRGEKGTVVTLTVIHEGAGQTAEISIKRDNIDIPIINTKDMVADHVFVISLYNFSANSAQQFRDALKEFSASGETKLILDLRGNPGGYLDAALDMASWFLPEGDIVVTEDFGGGQEKQYHRSRGYNVFRKETYKVAVLINGGSASASEILAGALSEHGVAKLVGTKSFGKGSVQELVDITPETSLRVTVARWLTPNGVSISHNGLVPDYTVELTADDLKNGDDKQLKKAIEILSK